MGSRRPVYHMSHDSFTLDGLYKLSGDRSLWWKLLDSFRICYPEWFLPRNFVLKVYEVDPSKGQMRPEERIFNEVEAYKRLERVQGRGVPRCYGLTIFQYRLALLLQYIDGVTLEVRIILYQSIKITKVSVDIKGQDQKKTDQESKAASISGSIAKVVSMLTSYGIKGDIKADNIVCNGDRITILDFDDAEQDSHYWVKVENEGGLSELLKSMGISAT